MDRRDFIKTGVVAGAAVVAGVGELPAADASKAPFDMDAFLRRTDQQLAGLHTRRSVGTLIPQVRGPLTDGQQAAVARAEELLHKTMRSLLFVGLLHDLPREQHAHAGVQQRLQAMMPEMDDAYYGLGDLMSSLSPADRIDLGEAIGDDPNLPMRVIEALDDEGAAVGVSATRRLHLRSIGTQVAGRLRHQNPSSVLSEYVDKAERLVVARGGQIEQRQKLAARLANQAIWLAPAARARSAAPVAGAHMVAQADQPTVDPGVEPPAPVQPTAPPPVETAPPPPPPPVQPMPQQAQLDAAANERAIYEDARRQKKLSTANGMVTAGGVLLGLAAVAGVVIVLGFTSPAWIVGAVAITFGVLFLIAGLILLIIGLVMRSQNQRPAAR